AAFSATAYATPEVSRLPRSTGAAGLLTSTTYRPGPPIAATASVPVLFITTLRKPFAVPTVTFVGRAPFTIRWLGCVMSTTHSRASPLASPPTTARVPTIATSRPVNGSSAEPITVGMLGFVTFTVETPNGSDATVATPPFTDTPRMVPTPGTKPTSAGFMAG